MNETNTTTSAADVVDLDRLSEISDHKLPHILELVDLYLRTTAHQIEQLRAALAARRAKDIAAIAHSWAGASLMAGMNAVVPFLRRVETAGSQANFAEADLAFKGACQGFERIKCFLEAHELSQPFHGRVKKF